MTTCDGCGGALAGKQIRWCSPECGRRGKRREWKAANRDKMNGYNARYKRRRVPGFIGVDCETVADRCVAVVCGDSALYSAWGGDDLPADECDALDTETMLTWLAAQPGRKVGFWFDYDVNYLLVSVPDATLDVLAEMNHCRWNGWLLRHIPGRMFQASHADGRTVTVWDAAGFHRGSFLSLLDLTGVATPAERAAIEVGKAARSEFATWPIGEVVRYSLLECKLLGAAMGEMVEASRRAGVPIRRYYGAGSMAAGLLEDHNVNQSMPGDKRSKLMSVARVERLHYGGRFETSMVGYLDGPVYGYDLQAAYPRAMADLPCLAHGRWRRVRAKRIKPVAAGAYRVEWYGPLTAWGLFPVRRRVGSLAYPSEGSGWYWGPEVEAALRAAPGHVKIIEGVEWVQSCDHRPFDWMAELVTRRAELAGLDRAMLKVATNAVYGKLAQRKGSRRWRTVEWAGLVTSTTRARLLDAIYGDDPERVLMVATDAVFSEQPLTLDRDAGWSGEIVVPWVFVAQPGIYWWGAPGDGTPRKSRGFRAGVLDLDDVRAEWVRWGIAGRIEVEQSTFRGYRSTGAGWITESRSVAFDPRPRRMPHTADGLVHWTRPPSAGELDASEIADMILELLDDEIEIPSRVAELEQPEPVEGFSIFATI